MRIKIALFTAMLLATGFTTSATARGIYIGGGGYYAAPVYYPAPYYGYQQPVYAYPAYPPLPVQQQIVYAPQPVQYIAPAPVYAAPIFPFIGLGFRWH